MAPFFQQRHHLWAQNASVLALHRGGDHAAETQGSSSELEWITSFYYPHNPLWHSGDGLPGLGPRGKGLDKLQWPAAQRQGTREGRRGRRVQRYLGSGALALRRGVASGWAWTTSRLLSNSRLRGENGRCRFRGLLSRRSPGATLSSCWAGALGQEVSHSLWRLLCFCEALSESFHRRSKEAAGGNWSIKEGDPVRVLDLRQREPQVALEHYQAGHRPSYGLGGSLGSS